jgi:hypothetical protein
LSPGGSVRPQLLGIACAIDRIHHEIEDERRRRE